MHPESNKWVQCKNCSNFTPSNAMNREIRRGNNLGDCNLCGFGICSRRWANSNRLCDEYRVVVSSRVSYSTEVEADSDGEAREKALRE